MLNRSTGKVCASHFSFGYAWYEPATFTAQEEVNLQPWVPAACRLSFNQDFTSCTYYTTVMLQNIEYADLSSTLPFQSPQSKHNGLQLTYLHFNQAKRSAPTYLTNNWHTDIMRIGHKTHFQIHPQLCNTFLLLSKTVHTAHRHRL